MVSLPSRSDSQRGGDVGQPCPGHGRDLRQVPLGLCARHVGEGEMLGPGDGPGEIDRRRFGRRCGDQRLPGRPQRDRPPGAGRLARRVAHQPPIVEPAAGQSRGQALLRGVERVLQRVAGRQRSGEAPHLVSGFGVVPEQHFCNLPVGRHLGSHLEGDRPGRVVDAGLQIGDEGMQQRRVGVVGAGWGLPSSPPTGGRRRGSCHSMANAAPARIRIRAASSR